MKLIYKDKIQDTYIYIKEVRTIYSINIINNIIVTNNYKVIINNIIIYFTITLDI